MSRPLVISDCDEVLIYMIRHFRDFLDEQHGIDFHFEGGDFRSSMRRRDSGDVLDEEEMWKFLNLFFDTEMHRQDAIPGAVEAVEELTRHADFVVLTNLKDHRMERRARQLADLGIETRVYTNQGPKGPALAAILEEFHPSRAIFIDDIAGHHQSAGETASGVTRLHLCGEPLLAPHIECAHEAGHAEARIDNWAEALPWLLEQLDKDEEAS